MSPTVFGIATLVWLVGAANRMPFEAASAMGWWCRGNGGAGLNKDASSEPLHFQSANSCQSTGVHLEAGAKYRIDVELPDKTTWRDLGVQVDSPAGVTSGSPGLTPLQRAVFAVSVPFRRQWSVRWFVPIARIGERGVDHYPLEAARTELTARTSGELFLFVNDSIAPINFVPLSFGWSSYYRNNEGSARIVVTKLENAP